MEHKETNDSVVIPDPEHDYHGHPNYFKVFYTLLLLFGLSLIFGYFFPPEITVALIFLAAIWKAALVVKKFMHLSFEPFLLWVGLAAVLFCLVAFFFGIYPDITALKLDVTPR